MRIHRHKYNAKRDSRGFLKFDSKKEARYYDDLQILERAGEVVFFLRQVPFDIGGGVKYRADFQVFYADGTVHFIDVKGYATQEYKMKKKLVEAI